MNCTKISLNYPKLFKFSHLAIYDSRLNKEDYLKMCCQALSINSRSKYLRNIKSTTEQRTEKFEH